MRYCNAGRARRGIAWISRYFGEPSDGAGPAAEFVAALRACGVLKDLELGKIIAGKVGKIDKYAQTAIIDMYSRCGEIGEARKSFDSHIQCRDAAPWNAMILGYVRNDRSSLALELFARMRGSACEPDGRSFLAGLAACSSLATKEQGELIDGKLVKLESLARGMALYSDAAKKGCHTEIFVANSMLDLCGKCGCLVDARKIFDSMECHDVVSWTSLLLVYVENCEEEIALELIELMEGSGCSPNSRTLVAGLMACSSLAVKDPGRKEGGRLLKVRCLEKGRDLHRRAVESGCGGDVFVASALIDMYSRCGSLEDAENAFAAITPSRDPVPWNALIHGCVLNGKSELALEKFQRMKATGCAPNDRTYVAVLTACSSLAAASKDEEEDGRAFSKARCLEKGLAIHAEAAKSQLDSDAYVASALVEMYARSGSMEDALAVFRKMVPCPTVAAWNSMILGYVASGESDVALKFFASMDERPDSQSFVAAMMAVSSLAAREEGDDHRRRKSFWLKGGIDLHDRAAEQGYDSDVYIACTLVDMYSKCGSMDRARRVFDEKCGAGNPNLDLASVSVVALNALLLGYAENEEPELALEIFEHYEETSQVNERTFVAAMVACSSMVESIEGVPDRRKLLERGRRIHSRARRKFFDDNVFVANSLVDFYAKCGSMADARAVFDGRARRRRISSPVPWNSMILGYAASGENELALELFASMRAERVAMDARTYVAALSACSNMAAPQSGIAIHAEICRQGLESREFVASSLVDFYAKCGKMGAACQVFDSIATKSTVLWNAVLAGYGCQGDSSRALETFQRMVDEGIELGSVTLLSILTACSRAGLVETGKKIFARMEFQPRIEHYQCMIDLLGRANRLEEALAMIRSMPYDATVVSWTTLLGACEKWKNVEIGELAFRSLVSLDENHGAAYTLMAKILAGSAGMPPPRGKSQELACGDGALNAAGDWRYKGEGASNVVLDYRGSDSQLLGTVLRIRKAPLRENGGGCAPVLSDLERNLWKDWPAVASSSNEEELRHVYVRDVMRPLLGEDYVDSGVIVPVSRKFLEDVSQHIRANRPAWRAEEADLDFSSKNVLAVCDHTLFPGVRANESDSPTLSIEIKPKWGYLPQSDAISTENHVKKVVSRFAMHQLLKFVQGKIRSSSSYCPLDLFSGTRDGIIKALNALFKSPQNNLRVFKDGNRIFTGSVDGAQDSTDSSASRDLLERSLVDFTDSVTGQRLDVLEKLIAEILHSSETLRKLLQTQQLDSLDIEGVIHLYYSFVGLHCPECGSDKTGCSIDSDVDKRSVLFASPHSMPADEQRRNLCKFLIAATAKDCSLMVTLKPLDDSIVASSVTRSIISCPTTGRSYVYKISFLDLDLKRLDKIPHYFRLDQSIVKFYAEHTT